MGKVKGGALLGVYGRGKNLRMWVEFVVWGLHYEISITLEELILGENFAVNINVVYPRCGYNTTGCTIQ